MLEAAAIRYLSAYNWKEQGFLPNPGGWIDQPNKLIEAMQFIGSEIAKHDKEKRQNDNQQTRSLSNSKR